MNATKQPALLTQDALGSVISDELTREDRDALEAACRKLELTSFASRLTAVLGRPIESASSFIPAPLRRLANTAATRALRGAMQTALRSLHARRLPSSPRIHRLTASATGAVGGAFGLISLPLELPVSTLLLLRAIADIARQHGEDLSEPATALACLQVFALGGRSPEDDFVDSSYYAVRIMLAQTLSEAARHIATSGASREAAPILMRLLSQIATRFGLVVTQKFAAQALPILGAAGGAMVNYAFMTHFQTLADGHFTIRRLERKYGQSRIQSAYLLAQATVLNK